MASPLKTFIIYARSDESFKNQLIRHIRPLQSISIWHDGNILPGELWDEAIKRELKSSELVLFLVSADSLFSDYIRDEELRTALEMFQKGESRLVPIIVSPCAWKYDPTIKGLQALPLYRAEGVKPVRSWSDPDEAWAGVVEHIGDMVDQLHKNSRGKVEKSISSAEVYNNKIETKEYMGGAQFVGTLKNGKMLYGTFTFLNGEKYVGEFDNEKRNGKGIYYYPNGTRFEGTFIDDQYAIGTFYHLNDEKYIGQFADNKRNGQGAYYYRSGKIDSGLWIDDKFIR